MHRTMYPADANSMGRFMLFPEILFTIILILVLIYLMYRFFNYFNAHQTRRIDSTSNEISNALQILNERLAKGEINEEEYKSKKELILKK